MHSTIERPDATGIRIENLDAALGAIVSGVDLATIGDEDFGRIRDALHDRGVVVIRGLQLSPDVHISFSRRFGEIEINARREFLLPGYPELVVLSNVVENGRPVGIVDAGQFWHTDRSYVAKPSMYSLLYALEIPHEGTRPLGDTLFASNAAAYEKLPEATRRRLQGLHAVHRHHHKYSSRPASGGQGEGQAEPDVIHPAVRTHPFTGRKSLYINDGHTVGFVELPESASQELLEELVAHCARPEFVYRHQWAEGDLVIWDDSQTQHRATSDYGPSQRRRLHRAVVSGSIPF